MGDSDLLKRELIILSSALNGFIDSHKDELSSKTVLLHELRDIGFVKISASKWALDLRMHDKSYVSFMLVFRGSAIDMTEDHIVIEDGEEHSASSKGKPYTLTGVRYSRVVKELLGRTQELVEIFKGKQS